eukprot:g18019.t1
MSHEWFSFGRNIHGELGRSSRPGGEVEGLENADVRPLELEKVVHFETISCGHFHNLGLSGGHVFAWGLNFEGQLGFEGPASTPLEASLAVLEEPVCSLAAGRSHSVFVTSGGHPFVCGRLAANEPGAATATTRTSSGPLQALRKIELTDATKHPEGKIIDCAAGESQAYFLSSEGELWSWLGEDVRHPAVDGKVPETRIARGAGARILFVRGSSCLEAMRIGVQLLKRMPMDFEPSETIARVKSKLESIFLDQLKKQGEEDVDEAQGRKKRMRLPPQVVSERNRFRKRPEEEQTLASAGLVENSTLVVLSRTLAEVHGKHSGVFSVRKAFEELAQSGHTGPEAEIQALKTAPPFSIFCNLQELGELGAGSFPEEALESWRNFTHTKRDRPIRWDYITAGNTGPQGADSSWPWLCALVSALTMLVILPQYARWQHRLRETLDRRQVDPDDFALFLDGLPSDARDEDEIKAFWLMNLTQCLKINSRTTRFRKRHVVRITRAANPSDILWENLTASHQTRLWLRAKTYAFVGLTLAGCLVLVVAINRIMDYFIGHKADRSSGALTTLSSLLVAFTVMGIRIWASLSIRTGHPGNPRNDLGLAKPVNLRTKTTRDVSLLAKLSLFYLTCYCVIAILVNWEPSYWYMAGNLVSDIATLMTFNCITIPLYIIFSCRMTQNQFQTFFELPEMDQTRPFAKVLLTFLMGFVFMPMWPYAILIASAALFFEYWAYKDYRCQKNTGIWEEGGCYQLLRQSKRPYRQSVDVAHAALRIVYIGLAGYALTQAIFLTPSLSEDQGTWSSTLTLPLLVMPLVLLCLSIRLQRLVCGGCVFEEKGRTSTSVDYYSAQRTWAKHQKYHTTNLRGFEMIDAAGKKLKYDPRTGNLPDPASLRTPPAPPAPSEGSRLGSLTGKEDLESGAGGSRTVETGPDGEDGAGFRWRRTREDSEELEEEPEETEAIAEEDPAALAMEEIKHKVPWHDEGDDEGDSGDSGDSEDSEASEEEPLEPLMLRSGVLARIHGLQKAGAEQFNGQTLGFKSFELKAFIWLFDSIALLRTCTVLQPSGEKWVVLLRDGRKAAMAVEHLQLKAKIIHLRSSQGKVYNSTICTLLRFDRRAEKWLVELFTGVEAHVPAENLDGTRAQRLGQLERPTARAVLGVPRVAKVTCGLHHTLILTEERQVFSLGSGSLGQLGLGPCRRCPSPTQVAFPVQCEGSITGIAAGFASSFAVTQHGWVYSWGCNEKCELGLGAAVRGAATPKPVDALAAVKVVQVSAGFSHTACITDSGLLYLWGYGAHGQLGFGFDDLRSSLRLGRGWSATGQPGAGARSDDAGHRSTGQVQPWQQAWPRRCRRGPFRSRHCDDVHCGAYHTIAKASSEPLSDVALKESEALRANGGFLHFFLFLCLDTQVFMREARREKSWSSGGRAGCAGAKEEMQKLGGYFRKPTFLCLVGQGLFGAIPWNAFGYSTMYFQVNGLSDAAAAGLSTLAHLSNATGHLLGGFIGDAMAKRCPLHGRPFTANFSVSCGIPCAIFIFLSTHQSFTYYAIFLVILGTHQIIFKGNFPTVMVAW